MTSDDPKKPTVLTKEMIEQLKAQLDAMEGEEIREGGPVEHKPDTDKDQKVAWYIAYSTSAVV